MLGDAIEGLGTLPVSKAARHPAKGKARKGHTKPSSHRAPAKHAK
jgi:hypothetical protein